MHILWLEPEPTTHVPSSKLTNRSRKEKQLSHEPFSVVYSTIRCSVPAFSNDTVINPLNA